MTRIERLLSRKSWALAAFVLLALILRAQTFGNPVIEFDEQFYRLVGERMLDGAMPYVDIWDRKPVGLFLLFAAASAIGGSGPLPYQLLACLFAGTTAFVLAQIAVRLTQSRLAAFLSGLFYLLWLNLLQGEGGQAAVFYTLPMALAALLVMRLYLQESPALLRDGALAMLLVGVAGQIKYTALLEGFGFGLILLWLGWKRGQGLAELAGKVVAWAGLAILPTLLAGSAFWMMGLGEQWWFANFASILLRDPMPASLLWSELAGGLGASALLIFAVWLGHRALPSGPARNFTLLWAGSAFAALLAMGAFGPHYWIALSAPLAVLAGAASMRFGKAIVGLAAIAALAGQLLIGYYSWTKGDQHTVSKMVAAIGPAPNCLYVFNGFPALYLEADACLATPFAFPGHLNRASEAGALGVDPLAEVERIMLARPSAVVMDEPRWQYGNQHAAAIVDAALERDYRLVLREPTGNKRWRLVYRLKSELP